MIQPEPDLTIQEAITELFPDPINLPQDVSAKDIVFIMSSDLGDGNKEVRAAKAKCDGNYACALAQLQRGVLKSETEGKCWICMQLHSVWKTQKITSEMVCLEENKSDMPKQSLW